MVAQLLAAKNQFTTDLANFQGDTTSFTLKDFELPDHPVTFTAVIPEDKYQPLPASSGPIYSGLEYDYDQDTEYREDLARADNAYNVQVRLLELAYGVVTSGIEIAHGTAVFVAKFASNNAVRIAGE